MTKKLKMVTSVVISMVMVLSMIINMPVVVSATNTADDIVAVAQGEVGSTNYSKYYGGHKDAWCADFVTWCAQQAGVSSITNSASCTAMYEGMKENGCQPVSTAQKGDLVFYYNQNRGSWMHVGIMVDETNAISGNYWSNNYSHVALHNCNAYYDMYYEKCQPVFVRPNYNDIPPAPVHWYDNLTPVDLGTDFYAYIINTAAWKHLTNDGDNVRMRSETGAANQVWKFERQYDSSYKIINCADNNILDICNFGTTNGTNVSIYRNNDSSAQRWYIYGESGAYFLRGQCGDLVLDINGGSREDGANVQMWERNDTDAQRFQIWILPEVSPTYVHYELGTRFTPMSIWWEKSDNAQEYDLKIWKDKLWEGDAYKIIWGIRGLECSVDLPEGYYEAYVDSRNNYDIAMSSNVIKFNVGKENLKEEPIDMGAEFYANIEHQSTHMYLTNQQNNIAGENANGSKNQIWRFERLSNGAYKIQSVLDNSYMDVYGVLDEDGTNIHTWVEYTGNGNQQFYIYYRYGAYYLRPAHTNTRVVDMSLADKNVALWVVGDDWEPQEFNIIKREGSPTGISLNKTSLSLYKGESYNLKATVTPDDATDKTVTWKSSNTSVATVSNGKVIAKSTGTTTITAKTSNGKIATCKITVTEPVIEVESISLNKTALSMNVGNTT